MRKRSREEEAERQRRRRSKGRSNRRTLKNIIIDDEETLRKALKAEGIHVTLSLEYAVIEKLRRMCNEYKRGQAAEAWKAYRKKRKDPFAEACPHCGRQTSTRCTHCHRVLPSRRRIISDFLIGAHALIQTDCLLTRDRGYYKMYFPRLTLVHPHGTRRT